MFSSIAAAFLATAVAQASPATEGPALYVRGHTLADGAKAMQRVDAGRARPEDAVLYANFVGIVTATHDSFSIALGVAGMGRPYCTSAVRTDQLVAVVAKHVLDKPEKWDKAGTDLVFEALLKAFPCGQPRRPEPGSAP